MAILDIRVFHWRVWRVAVGGSQFITLSEKFLLKVYDVKEVLVRDIEIKTHRKRNKEIDRWTKKRDLKTTRERYSYINPSGRLRYSF